MRDRDAHRDERDERRDEAPVERQAAERERKRRVREAVDWVTKHHADVIKRLADR